MGTGRPSFMTHPDVRIAAICDVDGRQDRAAVVALVQSTLGYTPPDDGDFRRAARERKDIDAVLISTPDHWHALPTVDACKAGKDVFVEKPLSLVVTEGRAMVKAARDNKRVVQIGNHITTIGRSSGSVVRAGAQRALGNDAVKVGLLGPTLGRPGQEPVPGHATAGRARLRVLARAGAAAQVQPEPRPLPVPLLLGLLGRDVHRFLVPHHGRGGTGRSICRRPRTVWPSAAASW